jgi:HD-GYP domain-containing protein (c-di-GMP phosphodiesterase class II)
MLQDLGSMDPIVVDAVLHHHERWDGKGYPSRITSTAIPQIARIIMLCDSVDAMLSDRPYRKALSVEAVRQELMRCAGTQFDPEIVNVMLERGTLEKAVELIDAVQFDDMGTSLMAV